jgi:hypothetical protein
VARASIKTVATVRGIPAHKRKLAVLMRPVLGGGILLAACAGAYLTLTHLHPPPPSPAPDMHSGSIVILAPDMHGCRHLSFDNSTGAIKDQGTGECNDPAASTAARLGQVSDSFQRR